MMNNDDKKLDLQIEGIEALARKLEPFLPRLSPAAMYQYSSTEKLFLESLLFRAMRFSVIPGNEVVLSQCLRAIPRQFCLPENLNFKEPFVFVPLVGELLSCVWQLGKNDLIIESLGDALTNLKMLSEHDQLIFETRLRLDLKAGLATYLQHPFRVDYTNLAPKTNGFNYSFELSKAEF